MWREVRDTPQPPLAAAASPLSIVMGHLPTFLAAGLLGIAVNFLSSLIIKLAGATTLKVGGLLGGAGQQSLWLCAAATWEALSTLPALPCSTRVEC